MANLLLVNCSDEVATPTFRDWAQMHVGPATLWHEQTPIVIREFKRPWVLFTYQQELNYEFLIHWPEIEKQVVQESGGQMQAKVSCITSLPVNSAVTTIGGFQLVSNLWGRIDPAPGGQVYCTRLFVAVLDWAQRMKWAATFREEAVSAFQYALWLAALVRSPYVYGVRHDLSPIKVSVDSVIPPYSAEVRWLFNQYWWGQREHKQK